VFGPRCIPRDRVVLGSDADDAPDRRVVRPGRGDHHRLSPDRVDSVVVAMVVRDEDEIGRDVLDRRIAPVEGASCGRRHVAERINEHSSALAGDEER